MRTTWRLSGLAAALTAGLVLAACGWGTGNAVAGPAPEVLPQGPLGPRNDAVVAAVGDEAIVFGGNDFFCPPTADCAAPEKPPFSDGAAYDVVKGEWRSIAEAPFGVDYAEAVSHGSLVYTLVQCEKAPNCPVGRRLLTYDVSSDTWDELAGVPGNGFHNLVFVGDSLFAISVSDETGEPDYAYNADAEVWIAVDPPPLPPTFDRFGVEWDGTLVLYGSPIEGPSKNKLVASYDPKANEWIELSVALSPGFQPYGVGDIVILNGHFGNADGSMHDPTTDTWAPLSFPPDADSWTGNIAGVIGIGEAQYESSHGWFLDIETDGWIELDSPVLDSLGNESITAVGESLFVFGGHYFTDDEVRIDGGATLWTPRG